MTARTPATITITHVDGIATLELADLPPEMQQRFGYDPAAAQAWLAQVARARQEQLARQQQQAIQQQQAKPGSSTNRGSSSVTSWPAASRATTTR